MKGSEAELLARLRRRAAASTDDAISQQIQAFEGRALAQNSSRVECGGLQYLSDHPQIAIITEVMRRLQAIDERLGRIEQALGVPRSRGQGQATAQP